MQEIGDKALNVLEFINEKSEVTNDDLISSFPDNPMLEVALLFELRFILYRTSSTDTFDYQISPRGRDYLERHKANLKQMEQNANFQQNIENGLQESNARVDLLNTQIDNTNYEVKKTADNCEDIRKQFCEYKKEQTKRSNESTFLSVAAIIIALISLLVAYYK